MAERSGVRVIGPLADDVEGLCEELNRLGYRPGTVEAHVRVLARLSHWLLAEHEGAELTEELVERFFQLRREAGCTARFSTEGMVRMLDYLRVSGAIVPAASQLERAQVTAMVDAYGRYMRVGCCFSELTIATRVSVARCFLSARAASGGADVSGLEPAEVSEFLLQEARRVSPTTAAKVAGALRSFLRFLFAAGVVDRDLSGAALCVAARRQVSLPKAIDGSVVAALLDSCDRTTPAGLRDFAVLTLLVRLGLRAIEVASMRLDDLDWEAGELVVRGKSRRMERLPLPVDVGEALAAYLIDGRPRSDSRAVFLSVRPPVHRAMSRAAVKSVPGRASQRVGIGHVGPHRLRHTAATEMLRRGASMREIAQVLRQDSESTTAIYAKVDRSALDLVVQAWPGILP